MKKELLSCLLILLAIMGHAVNPENLVRASVDSKDLGKNNDTVPEFKLGHVNFLTDNSGSTTYKNGWIRNTIEWCLYRSYDNGPLLVKADAGYWIKDITFYYSMKSGGMLADVPGDSQQKIAAYDSAKAIVVNGPQKQFYVGKTSKGDGGYLTITRFSVTYCKTPDSLSLEDLSLKLGEVFQLTPQTFPAGSDTVFSWKSGNNNVVAVDKYGVITAKDTGVTTIWVRAGALVDSCLVKVEADTSASVVETFSHCMVDKNYSGTTGIIGDNRIFNWKVTNYQRQLTGTDDKVGDKQGIRVRYKGSIATDSVQQGGIKAVAFDWRSTNNVNVINYCVKVGEQCYEYNSDAVDKASVYHFAREFAVKENVSLSFEMVDKIGLEGQAYVIVGPITITPYLLFNIPGHSEVIRVDTMGSFDLNKVLINNTGEQPQFTVTDNTTGATTQIEDGVLTICGKKQPGEIVVTATWNKVSTTMTLCVEDQPRGGCFTETFSNCYADKLFDGRIYIAGDDDIYDWSIARFQRTTEDSIAGEQGIRIRYNGSISSCGAQEGGVKDLIFDWRATGEGMPVHFLLQVGDTTYDYSSSTCLAERKHLNWPCHVAANVSIKMSVPDEESPAQSYVVVGPLTIVPYLLFNVPNRKDTVRLVDATSYDLRDVLMDNTENAGTIEYTIISDDTQAAVINGSVVDLNMVENSGKVIVKATWGMVSTTMTLWVDAEEPADIRQIQPSTTQQSKILLNNNIYIVRGACTYDLQGNVIK